MISVGNNVESLSIMNASGNSILEIENVTDWISSIQSGTDGLNVTA